MVDVPEVPAPASLPEASSPEKPASAFDPLFVTPDQAEALRAERAAKPAMEPKPEDPEEKDEDAGEVLSEAIGKITKAMEKLSKKGLNMRAVIALLHDANPSIPKKQIKAVLEGLRELPAIYGRDAAQR